MTACREPASVLIEQLSNGETTSLELTEACLAEITSHDGVVLSLIHI